MKVLVASTGTRPADFACTVKGELVTLPLNVCSSSDLAEECGCSRSLTGLHSMRSTTVGIVAERPEEDVRLIVEGSPLTSDWASNGYDLRPDLWDTARWLDDVLDDVDDGTEARVKNVLDRNDRVSELELENERS